MLESRIGRKIALDGVAPLAAAACDTCLNTSSKSRVDAKPCTFKCDRDCDERLDRNVSYLSMGAGAHLPRANSRAPEFHGLDLPCSSDRYCSDTFACNASGDSKSGNVQFNTLFGGLAALDSEVISLKSGRMPVQGVAASMRK